MYKPRLDDKLELTIPVHERFGKWKLVSLNPVKKGCQVKVLGQSTMGFFHTSTAPRNIGGSFKVRIILIKVQANNFFVNKHYVKLVFWVNKTSIEQGKNKTI